MTIYNNNFKGPIVFIFFIVRLFLFEYSTASVLIYRVYYIIILCIIGVRRAEFRGVPTIFSGPFLNLGPLLTRHVHILINYNA
jgi:hypothetical protein